MKKRILFVCLGNICRSPAAEAVFLSLIRSQGVATRYHVDSAGTGAWHVGNKADIRMRNAAKKRNISIDSIARQLTIDDFSKFDFILTMDNDNLKTVKSLIRKIDLKQIPIIKPILSYSDSSNLIEVPDPYYGGKDGFERVLDLLEESCNSFLKELDSID